MRYLLTLLGFLGVFSGLIGLSTHANQQVGAALLQSGALCLAIGLATSDIVEAIRRRLDKP